MRIRIPKDAKYVIDKLKKRGFEAYVVGGCVRDSILGKEPKDWDICTNATPDQMIEVFKNDYTYDVGLKHGTLTVVRHGEGYEVTTYRVDGDYSDGRHPDKVYFTSSLKEDLARRDLTINALAYSEEEGIVDFYGGLSDLKNHRIRAVGIAADRFTEDALRIMRAMRFAAVLNFEIEESTAKAMHVLKDRLQMVSEERKTTEINKMLLGDGVAKVLREFKDVLATVIPEMKNMFDFQQHNPYHDFDVWEHTIEVVAHAPKDLELRLAALFHDIGKPLTYTNVDGVGHFYGHATESNRLVKEIMTRLRYSNALVEAVATLVLYHDMPFEDSKRFIMRAYNKMGKDLFTKLISLREADVYGQRRVVYTSDERLLKAEAVRERMEQLSEEENCFTLKQLNINGTILMSDLGMKPSPKMGIILNTLLNKVIADELENDAVVLLEEARKLLSNM